MVARPCLDCGTPTHNTRCLACDQVWRKWTKATGSEWQRFRSAVLADHPFCAICGTTRRLTVDHILPMSMGGAKLDRRNVRVLCSVCHGRYGRQRNR